MSNDEINEMKEIEMENQKNNKPQISGIFLFGAILALILFAAASFYAGRTSAPVPPVSSEKSPTPVKPQKKAAPPSAPVYKLEDFKRKVEELRSKHDAANRQLFLDFKCALQSAGEPEFARARANIGSTVARFCNFKACAHLTYTMARDKIKGTQDAQNLIGSVVRSKIMQPCAAGGAAIQDVTANFIHRLQENDNRFRAQCAAELKKFPEAGSDLAAAQNFVNDLTEFNRQLENYVMTSAFTTIGTALEIILIRQTIAAIGRLLGPVVVKVAGSAAAPFLDGPLPIGDIIAVAGFVWCSYDIYQVLKVLPQKMRNTLLEAIGNYSSNARAEARTKAEKALNHSINSAQKVIDALP